MGTDIDYGTVAHETIYQHVTGGAGSVDMVEASRGWQSVAAKLEQLHGDVEQAVRGIGAAQRGASADAATHATTALVPWLADSVAAAQGIAERISHQAGSFGHTRDSMPPPVRVPEVSLRQDPATWMGEHAVEWLPGIQTGHERDQVAAQQAEQRARELMSTYQGSSNDNLAVSQHFAAAPAVVADVSDPSLSGGSGIGGASGGAAVNPAPSDPAHPMMAHPNPAPTGPATAGAAAGTPPQLTPVARQAPAVATTPQLAGGYHPGADGQSVPGSGQVRPTTAAPFGPSPILAASSASPAGGHLPRGGARVPGGGSTVSRGGSGFGPRPTPTLGEGHSLTGSGWQASAEQASAEHAGAGGPGRGGGTGLSGAPLGATGSSGRDGKSGHQRPSYLIEQDTNAIVGDLPRVAPPVIGDDG